MIANTPGGDDPVSLRDLAKTLELSPSAQVVELMESPTGPPLLLVDLPEADAERLARAFDGRLTIERDAPLQPGAAAPLTPG